MGHTSVYPYSHNAKGKAYQQYLENTENKAELIDLFTRCIQQDHVRSKLKENV